MPMINKIKEMFIISLSILLACVYDSHQAQQYNPAKFKTGNHDHASHRILQLMRSYYEEANARITYMNPMRFMYEESPFYEMGYITGEIIERYRKVVEHAQRPVRFKFYTVFDVLKRVELVQKLYFELYHLVRMIHETPRKWRSEPEFVDIEKMAGPELLGGRGIDGKGKKYEILTEKQLSELHAVQQSLLEQQRNREKEKRRQKKKFEKIRQAFLQGLITEMKPEKKPYNNYWPLDYGWEIHYPW